MHYRRLLRGQDLTASPRYGGAVKYQMAHQRVKKLWGVARDHPCVSCGADACEWSYDGTDPDELEDLYMGYLVRYSPWPEFYMPMCISCHRNFDTVRHGISRGGCIVDGCVKVHHGNGLCNTHWKSDHKRRRSKSPILQ